MTKGYDKSYIQVSREHNNQWCENCSSPKDLTVHHKNHDKKDASPENLKVLCRKCHDLEDAIKRRKIKKKKKIGKRWKC